MTDSTPPAPWFRSPIRLSPPRSAHRGNGGVYGVADQMVWRGAASSVNLFLRGGVSPSDRNLVSYYADGGIGLNGPLPGRANDTLTFGVAYSKISPASRRARPRFPRHQRAALRHSRR